MLAPTKAHSFCTNQFHKSHHLRITKFDFWLILKRFKIMEVGNCMPKKNGSKILLKRGFLKPKKKTKDEKFRDLELFKNIYKKGLRKFIFKVGEWEKKDDKRLFSCMPKVSPEKNDAGRDVGYYLSNLVFHILLSSFPSRAVNCATWDPNPPIDPSSTVIKKAWFSQSSLINWMSRVLSPRVSGGPRCC